MIVWDRHAFCPNCGKRYLHLPDDFVLGPGHGCGDCAQGGVRPRELYELKPLQDYTLHSDVDCSQ